MLQQHGRASQSQSALALLQVLSHQGVGSGIHRQLPQVIVAIQDGAQATRVGHRAHIQLLAVKIAVHGRGAHLQSPQILLPQPDLVGDNLVGRGVGDGDT